MKEPEVLSELEAGLEMNNFYGHGNILDVRELHTTLNEINRLESRYEESHQKNMERLADEIDQKQK